jgi:hypothetical protein
MRTPYIKGPPEVRYEAKVDRSGGPDACHPWTASMKKGYGQLNVDGRSVQAHRWAFKRYIDPTIRDDEYVRHTCDNPPCQNPQHWLKGTNSDNIKDAVARGRHPEANKTHCKHGHPFDETNTYRRPDRPRSRTCRTCNNESSLKYYPKRGHKPRSDR